MHVRVKMPSLRPCARPWAAKIGQKSPFLKTKHLHAFIYVDT
jgi:hypothetical protein